MQQQADVLTEDENYVLLRTIWFAGFAWNGLARNEEAFLIQNFDSRNGAFQCVGVFVITVLKLRAGVVMHVHPVRPMTCEEIGMIFCQCDWYHHDGC
eukprot:scaffold2716_cov179-Amphora_coffeaeformis.AAC.1